MFKRLVGPRKYQHWSDQELLKAFREEGTEACFSEIFERYAHLTFLATLKFVDDREQSKDVTMVIFSKVYQFLQQETPEFFNTWLFSVIRNECVSYLRKDRRLQEKQLDWQENQKKSSLFMENEGFERLIDKRTSEEEQALLEAMRKLEENQQKCLELFYFEKMSYKEIAGHIQCSVKQVKSHLQNGKRQLRLQLMAFSQERSE